MVSSGVDLPFHVTFGPVNIASPGEKTDFIVPVELRMNCIE